MVANEPSPETTLGVILGAQQWPGCPALDASPACATSGRNFENYLCSSSGLGLPAENVKNFFDDPRRPGEILEDIRAFLERRERELGELGRRRAADLLFYYVGHGDVIGSDNSYCLILRYTKEVQKRGTSLQITDLFEVIRAFGRHLRCYIILDACFSSTAARFIDPSSYNPAGDEQLPQGLPRRGVTLLCSSGEGQESKAPPGEPYPWFSGALLEVLAEGHAQKDRRLSLRVLAELTATLIRDKYKDKAVWPQVHSPVQLPGGDVADVPLFPNKAVEAVEALDIEGFEDEVAKADFVKDNPYLLGKSYVGREQEQTDLTLWLKRTHPVIGDTSILCICDFGGAGKTALVWHWLNKDETQQFLTENKYSWFWATFYAKNYDWVAFLFNFAKELNLLDESKLRYIRRLGPQGLRYLQEDILTRLRDDRWVIILDGLEREMGAFDHPDNQLLDSEAQDLRNEQGQVPDTEKCLRSPVFVEFVRGLLSTRAKVVITSRLVPENLKTDDGTQLGGVFEYPFRPLTLEDASKVWELGEGDAGRKFRNVFFERVGFHPQVIGAVSAAVKASQTTGLEEWFEGFLKDEQSACLDAAAHKTTLRHRWLDLATRDIAKQEKKAWIALCHIASRSDATDIDGIAASLVAPASDDPTQRKLFTSEDKLIEELQKLEKRWLLGADFSRRVVDVHPVIRSHVTKYVQRQYELDPTEADQEVLVHLDATGGTGDIVHKLLTQRQLEEAMQALDDTTITELADRYGYKASLVDILGKFYAGTSLETSPWLAALPALRYRKDQALCLLRTGSALMKLGRWEEAPILFRRAALAYQLCGDFESVKLCQRHQDWQILYGGSLWKCEQYRLHLLEAEKSRFSNDPYWLALSMAIRQCPLAYQFLDRLPADVDRWTLQTVAEAWYYLEKYDKSASLALASLQRKENVETTQRLWERVTLGLAQLRRGVLDQAFNHLHWAIEKGTGHSYPIVPMFARAGYVECLYMKAMSSPFRTQQLETFHLALDAYKRYIQVDPNGQYQIPASEAHLAVARVRLALGEREKAIEMALRSLRVARGQEAPFCYAAGEKRATEFLELLLGKEKIPPRESLVNAVDVRKHESRIQNVLQQWEAKPTVEGSTRGITNTKGWSDERIRAKLAEVKVELDWANTTGSARKWWEVFENENSHRLALVLRLAEELANRKATITAFFLATVDSNTDNIQANLSYMDYTRLKKEGEREKREAAQKGREGLPTERVAASGSPAPTSYIPPGITNTKGWSDERIREHLENVKGRLDWANTTGSARKWWEGFETQNSHHWALVLRLAEELANRKATITEFFLATVDSNTDNIQGNLHYLDYIRLKKEEERKKQEAAAPANEAAEKSAARQRGERSQGPSGMPSS